MPTDSAHLLLPGGRKIYLDAQSGVQYTRTIGIGHNLNAVVAPMELFQGNYPVVGTVCTLVLIDPTTGLTLNLSNETIHETEVEVPLSGGNVKIVLKDARHVLNQGSITGYFNVPHAAPKVKSVELDGDGNPIVPLRPIRPRDQLEIVQHTLEKLTFPATLRELVRKCFEALGLGPSDFDLSMLKIIDANDLPNPNPDNLQIGNDLPIYPAVKWEFANPAREAERLLNEHGMAVTLWTQGVNGDATSPVGQMTGGDLGGKLVVVRLGRWHPQQRTGFIPPPETGWDRYAESFTSTGLAPLTIVVGGRTIVEEVTELEPVGLDLDGEVRRLADLSYVTDVSQQLPYGRFERVTSEGGIIDVAVDPTNGNIRIPQAGAGGEPFTIDDVIKVASESLWKWYGLPPSHLWKLPMLTELVSTRNINGQPVRKEPYVDLEAWRAEIASGQLGADIEIEDLAGRYQVDLIHGIVKFHEMTVTIDGDRVKPAKVKLHWSRNSAELFSPLNGGNPDPNPEKWRAKVRAEDFFTHPAGADLTQANTLNHPELVLFQRIPENAVNGPYTDVNRDELEDYAQKLIERARYTSQPFIDAPSGNVVGLVKFSTDGYVRQITWSIQGGASSTLVSGNRERQRGVLALIEPYESRLFKRQTVAVVKGGRGGLALPSPESFILPIIGNRNPTIAPESPRLTLTRPGTVQVMNVSGVFIPAFSFVQIVSWNNRLGLLHVQPPTSPLGERGFLVNQTPLPPKTTGYAAHTGMTMIRLKSGHDFGYMDTIGPDINLALPGDTSLHTGPLVASKDGSFPLIAFYGMGSGLASDRPVGMIQMGSAASPRDYLYVIVTQPYSTTTPHYVLGRRLIPDPQYDGHYGWIKDPDDLTDYVIRPTAGGGSIYPGMRLWIQYSHLARAIGPVGAPNPNRVFVPRAGDCFGFQASITGAPTTGTEGEKYYPWTTYALGLQGATPNEIRQSDVEYEGYTWPKALLLQSLRRDELLATLDMGPAHVWMTPGSTPDHAAGFVFSGPFNPTTTTQCSPTP